MANRQFGDPPGSTETIPADISSAGEAVGSENSQNGTYRGFLFFAKP